MRANQLGSIVHRLVQLEDSHYGIVQLLLEKLGEMKCQEEYEVLLQALLAMKPGETDISLRVSVDRSRSIEEALRATGATLCLLEQSYLKEVPPGVGNEVEVVFFRPDRFVRGDMVSPKQLMQEYSARGLAPADPFTVAAVNEVHRDFAKRIRHHTLWLNAQRKRFVMKFSHVDYNRCVHVGPSTTKYNLDIWWAGIRLPS